MRLISFSMTRDAFLNGSKTVTRRLGWKGVKAGDRLMAVEKGQGLKKGEKVKRLGEIKIVSVRREPLDAITAEDVVLEGFPNMTPADFIRFFAIGHGMGDTSAEVTRIEFRRVASTLKSVDKAAGIERGADGLPARLYL